MASLCTPCAQPLCTLLRHTDTCCIVTVSVTVSCLKAELYLCNAQG